MKRTFQQCDPRDKGSCFQNCEKPDTTEIFMIEE